MPMRPPFGMLRPNRWTRVRSPINRPQATRPCPELLPRCRSGGSWHQEIRISIPIPGAHFWIGAHASGTIHSGNIAK